MCQDDNQTGARIHHPMPGGDVQNHSNRSALYTLRASTFPYMEKVEAMWRQSGGPPDCLQQ